MAKKNNAARVTDDTLVDGDMPVSETTGKTATPEGFEDVSSDIEAVYDYRHEKSVFVRPLHYTLSDSKVGDKPQILIHAELTKPATLVDMQDDGEEVVTRQFPVGTRVGIWYRPGLRQIMQCAGSETFIAFDGERNVGQIQPMKIFKVSRRKGAGAAQLTCASDYRKKTKRMPLPWEDASEVRPQAAKGSTQPAPNDDDDVPF